MKRNKRLVCLLACIICAAMVTSCTPAAPQQTNSPVRTPASNTPTQGSTATEAPPTEPEVEMEGNLYLSGLPIVEKPITYTVLLSKSALDKSPSFADKEILKEAEALSNISFDWMEIPASGWSDRVNIVLSSGVLPDIILGSVNIMQNTRALTEITDEMLAKYMPNYFQYIEDNPLVRGKLTTPDGKMYTLPAGGDTNTWDYLQDAQYINTQWLETLGMKIPTTTDEFYDVLVAAKNAGDLNGNGIDDEIPFGFCELDGFTLRSMFGSWGVINTATYVNVRDGEVFFAPSDDGFYEGLKWLNKLFSEGLMDPEGFSQPRAQYNSKSLMDPPVYFVLAASTIGNTVAPTQVENYEHILPLAGPDGTQLTRGRVTSTAAKNSTVMITNKCAEPAPFMRWMDWHSSDMTHFLTWQHGDQNVGWEYTDDLTWTRIIDPPAAGYNNNDEYRFTVGFMGEATLFSVFNTTYARDLSSDSLTLAKERTALAFMPYYEKEVVYTDMFQPEAQEKERALLFADIDTYMKSFVATSVTNGIDDAGWQTHLSQLQRLNINDYVAIYQKMFDTQPKTGD